MSVWVLIPLVWVPVAIIVALLLGRVLRANDMEEE